MAIRASCPHLAVLLIVIVMGVGDCEAQQRARPQGSPAPTTVVGEPVTVGEQFQLHSEHLRETRTFRVYVPPSHDDSPARYPVVYVLDGEAYFLHTASTARSLARLGLMPEAIVVAVHNTNRRLDMTPPSMSLQGVPKGGADHFLAFFEEELIPFIERRYRTLPLRVLIGHSHGGLLSNYALVARPQLFRWHLAIDSPVHLNNYAMERQIEAFLTDNPDHVGRLVAVWSSYHWSDRTQAFLANQAPAGFFTESFDLPGETHESMYFEGIYKGLKRLFHDSVYDRRQVKTLAELEAQYHTLSAQYGYPVPIPRRALRDNVEENLFVAQPDRARPLLEKLIDLYGASEEVGRFEEWLRALVENPVEETGEDLLNSRPATPSDIAPFLGVWEGLLGGTIPVEVIFDIQDGTVVGRTVQTLPGGKKGTFEHVVARVVEDGTLEWGYMNKMFPRSLVMAYSGRLEDENTLRAIGKRTMSLPPGMSGGALQKAFTLKRKKE